ncbi:MAG: type III-B CRISPR module RAMP protein Cmr6 [Chloracidobacterium sp.]
MGEIGARRAALNNVAWRDCAHPGLGFERFLLAQLTDKGDAKAPDVGKSGAVQPGEPPRTALVKAVAGLRPASLYAAWYARWKHHLSVFGAQMREAEVVGRLVVGLGADSVSETAISLHRTYGVPVIPGSALKGLAAAYAHRYVEETAWRKLTPRCPQGSAHRTLFGSAQDTDPEAGYVIFFDALWVPGSAEHPLAADVMAVHHADYYQGRADWPADWDSPTVVPFLTATGKFLLALAGPPDWVDAAFDLLDAALAKLGGGAKTAAGYGRLRLEAKAVLPPDPSEVEADQLVAQIKGLRSNEVAARLGDFAKRWQNLPDGVPGKRRVAEAIVDQSRVWKGAKDKPWFREVKRYLDPTE